MLTFPTLKIVLKLKYIAIGETEVHAFKLLQIRKSFTAYLDVTQFWSKERQRSWFSSVRFNAMSNGNAGGNEDKSSKDDIEGEGNENDGGEEEEEGESH